MSGRESEFELSIGVFPSLFQSGERGFIHSVGVRCDEGGTKTEFFFFLLAFGLVLHRSFFFFLLLKRRIARIK